MSLPGQDSAQSLQKPPRRSVGWFIAAAVSLALASGLCEALVSLALSTLQGILGWKTGNSVKVLFAAPAVYLLLFLPAGVLFALLDRVFRSRWVEIVMVFGSVTLLGVSVTTLMRPWFSASASVFLGLGLGSVATRIYASDPSRWGAALVRSAPWLAALVLLSGGIGIGSAAVGERIAIGQLPAAAASVPNVLLIVMDTQRADHLTAYGYGRPTTPRLTRLASEGVRFNLATSPAATTLPSHSSMMTGHEVGEHGAGVNGRLFLDRRLPTLAEQMRAAGYLTGGFVANTYWTGRHTGLNRGFIHYEDFYSSLTDGFTRTVLGRAIAYTFFPMLGRTDIPGRKRAGDVDRELLHWLDGKGNHPFFVFLNYFDVHAPYRPPAGYAGRFTSRGESLARPKKIDIGAWNEGTVPDSAVLISWRDRYDESLLYLDHEIGALLDSLAARRLLEKTVVIVTGDHGESFGEHGTVHHGATLYLEQIRVPLILWGPGRIPAGRQIDRAVDLRSIPATVLDMAGIPAASFPGQSLLSYLDSPDSLPERAISEGPLVPGNPPTWQTGKGWVKSVATRRWHLIEFESGGKELYDLTADPSELRNLAELPQWRDTLALLERDLPPALGSSPADRRPE
ncbi:MAG TPA: sulfatase [Gemmatimonadales bacterium]|nr:sulfatase [Gemmatimonadales bacterium]